MLYFIGLGLGDAKDITVKGLEIVKTAKKVFLEHYTSILGCDKAELEEFYGRELILADRDLVESGAEEILEDAKDDIVAFLVVGDPFGATTHSDLDLRYVRSRTQNLHSLKSNLFLQLHSKVPQQERCTVKEGGNEIHSTTALI